MATLNHLHDLSVLDGRRLEFIGFFKENVSTALSGQFIHQRRCAYCFEAVTGRSSEAGVHSREA